MMTYFDYLKNNQKEPWWSAAIGGTVEFLVSLLPVEEDTIDENIIDPFQLTKVQTRIVKSLEKKVLCEVDNKALLIYIIFRWIRGTSAMSIFLAIISLYVIRVIVSAFNMRLMTNIMETVLDVGLIALIVIFQPEIRKFLIRLGNRYMNSARGRKILDRILGRGTEPSGLRAFTTCVAALQARCIP